MKILMCVACLCSAAMITKTALTQETPVDPQNAAIPEPVDDRFEDSASTRKPLPPTQFSDNRDEQPLDPVSDSRNSVLVPNSYFPDDLTRSEYPRAAQDILQSDDGNGRVVPGGLGRLSPLGRPRRVARTVIETIYEKIPPEELEASDKLQSAIKSLRTGKDETVRKAAADVIQQQLTAQFESDLKQREKELAKVEQGVKSLREQLDKRKASQAVIINLRLQTLVNEANGLGFPDPNFRADAKSAPTLFSDDLDRAVSSPRQLPQVRQLDPGP